MFCLRILLLVLLTVISLRCVKGDCVESIMITCDNIEDLKNYDCFEWQDLMIDPKLPNTILHKSLTKDFFDKCFRLKWIYISRQFNDIELHIPYSLDILVLYDNNIERMKTLAFQNGKLEKLGLRKNNIQHLEQNSFSHLIIEYLDLSNNKISVITSTVFGKCNITNLFLKNNELIHLEDNAIPTDIRRLDLSYNKLEMLNNQLLSKLEKLQYLYINHNKLRAFPNVSNLTHLQSLSVAFNNIHEITTTFVEFRELFLFDLTGNQLTKFNFNYLPSKQMIVSLAYNHLTNLEPIRNNDFLIHLTLFGNPWNCKCLDRLEEYLKNNDDIYVRTNCDSELFGSGEFPICVIGSECQDTFVSDDIVKIFKDTIKRINCPLYAFRY